MQAFNKKILHIVYFLLLIYAIALISNGTYIYAKAELAQYLISHAWQQTLVHRQQTKPWPWADTWPIARLQINDNGQQKTYYILHGADGASLPFGPGHINGSSNPGEAGSSIIAGHRDTHFDFLQRLKIGQKIQIQNRRGDIIWYQVKQSYIADSRKQQLQARQQVNNLLLVTCYPFNAINPGGPLRYVVVAGQLKT